VMTVSQCINASSEIQSADKYKNAIRLFTVGQGTSSKIPLEYLNTVAQTWAEPSSMSVGGKNWTYFSAACWYFGKNLYDKLKIPIGLVSTNWGGTSIEKWSSSSVFERCPSTLPVVDRSILFNSMISPFLKMSIKGAIWYQGESNVKTVNHYSCLFKAMINDWREKWGKTFPFLFVQLAAYVEGTLDYVNLPEMRLVQHETVTDVPLAAMATAADLGDMKSEFGNIHPRNKQDIGYRLSLAARGMVYEENIVYSGPVAIEAEYHEQSPKSVIVSFDHNTIGTGLTIKDSPCIPASAECGYIDIQTSDKEWTKVSSFTITPDNKLEVHFEAPGKPIAIRYGFNNWPIMNIWNEDGLPALPFFLSINSTKKY